MIKQIMADLMLGTRAPVLQWKSANALKMKKHRYNKEWYIRTGSKDNLMIRDKVLKVN